MAKEIKIKWNDSEYTVIVDDDAHALLSRHTWYIMYSGDQKKPYAFAELYSMKNGEKIKRMFYMHQMVTGSFTTTDHINGNTLDNRFDNLRPATPQENGWNKPKNRKSCTGGSTSSQYKGVTKHISKQGVTYWRVLFKITKKNVVPAKFVRMGPYATEIEAARVYNEEIVKHRGKWAWLNPIPDDVTRTKGSGGSNGS